MPRAPKPVLTFPEQTEPEWFHFSINGKDYSLPSVHTNLSLGATMAGRNARSLEGQLSTYIEIEADEDTLAAIKTLRGSQQGDFAMEWVKFEGADAGE